MEVNLESEDEARVEEAEESPMEEEPPDDSDGEAQPFDITLAATHSYMGGGLVSVRGRSVLEAGWAGRVPVAAHHGAVFPGETLPLRVEAPRDAALLTRALHTDKLFGLLVPDESGSRVSRYGVLCEVFEAEVSAEAVTCKARAVHRFKLTEHPPPPLPITGQVRMQVAGIRVLPEVRAAAPLRHTRLASLDTLRAINRQDKLIKTMDAAVTPWPGFVYEIFDYERMRRTIAEYFATLGLAHLLPEEAVSLSYWVASNLTLGARDRLALFLVDDALQRLHMECTFIHKKSVLCCSTCMSEIARREHVFAMSSDGVHSNYTNIGGYVHDVVTVRSAHNTVCAGAAVSEYSWFPGYAWRVAVCAACSAHLGWRFTATRRHLKPASFYGLCRNYVQPRDPAHTDEPADTTDDRHAGPPYDI